MHDVSKEIKHKNNNCYLFLLVLSRLTLLVEWVIIAEFKTSMTEERSVVDFVCKDNILNDSSAIRELKQFLHFVYKSLQFQIFPGQPREMKLLIPFSSSLHCESWNTRRRASVEIRQDWKILLRLQEAKHESLQQIIPIRCKYEKSFLKVNIWAEFMHLQKTVCGDLFSIKFLFLLFRLKQEFFSSIDKNFSCLLL